MFNKKYINVLCKILAIGVYVILGILFAYQLGVSAEFSYKPVECIGHFIGSMIGYSFFLIIVYLFAFVVHKFNNK